MARPPYDQRLRPLARKLRKRMPKSERRLWSYLRRKQVQGHTFYRQFIILQYIVDFYCRTLRLAVEVDGLSHDDPDVAEHDLQRQQDLEDLGITVLRFSSDRVLNDLDNVLRAIHGCVSALSDGGDASSPG
jgi:very-short-patch-repair endonuclease